MYNLEAIHKMLFPFTYLGSIQISVQIYKFRNNVWICADPPIHPYIWTYTTKDMYTLEWKQYFPGVQIFCFTRNLNTWLPETQPPKSERCSDF